MTQLYENIFHVFMKKLVSVMIWTLPARLGGKHANRYTTVLMQFSIAENNHNTNFAGHNKTRSFKHWEYQRHVVTTILNNYHEFQWTLEVVIKDRNLWANWILQIRENEIICNEQNLFSPWWGWRGATSKFYIHFVYFLITWIRGIKTIHV